MTVSLAVKINQHFTEMSWDALSTESVLKFQ